MLLFALPRLLAGQQDFRVWGILVTGGAATALRWAIAASGLALFALSHVAFWLRLLRPGRRIAFTPDGILLPRHRLAIREDYVPYREVEEAWPETYHEEVTGLNFVSRHGKFFIAKVQLPKGAFDEVAAFFLQRVRESKPLPPGTTAASHRRA
jgi:hypothetical protein